jgi:polar amino acid transport system substrate-binding protein
VKRLSNILALAFAMAAGLHVSGAVAQDVYKVGIDQTNYEPFAWKDASGAWLGWEIELLQAVCESQGMTCEVAPTA